MENKPKEIIQNVAQKEELDNMSKREEDRQDKKKSKIHREGHDQSSDSNTLSPEQNSCNKSTFTEKADHQVKKVTLKTTQEKTDFLRAS